MKIYSKLPTHLLATASCLVFGALVAPSATQAQVSGGTYGLKGTPKESDATADFRIRTKPIGEDSLLVTLTGDFQKGAPEAHAFAFALDQGAINGIVSIGPEIIPGGNLTDGDLKAEFDGGDGPDYLVGSDAADSFDGGDGPDYLVGSDAADSFDGGDGPDYLVGSDAADSFDGGDGPDYLVGSDAADSFDGGDGPDYLVGSDAADSFDGGDGPDYLVGSDAADSVRIEIQFVSSRNDMPVVREIATSLYDLIAMTYESLPVLRSGLRSNGNEVAIYEAYGVSLKADGNEVAIIQSLDQRSVEQRWFEWSLFEPASNIGSISALACDFDVLLFEKEFGIINEAEFEFEVTRATKDALLYFGIFAE